MQLFVFFHRPLISVSVDLRSFSHSVSLRSISGLSDLYRPPLLYAGTYQAQTCSSSTSNLGVPVTENNGRFGKWSGALGQLINMIKWVTGGVKTPSGHVNRHFALQVAHTVINGPKMGLRCGTRRAAELRARGCIGPRRSGYAPCGWIRGSSGLGLFLRMRIVWCGRFCTKIGAFNRGYVGNDRA